MNAKSALFASLDLCTVCNIDAACLLDHYSRIIIFAVLAIQAKKKRKNPKGRKSGNAKEDPTTPGSGPAGVTAATNNGQSRETRSAQPR